MSSVQISVLPTTRDLGRTPVLHRKGFPANRAWLLRLVSKFSSPRLAWAEFHREIAMIVGFTTWCNLYLQVAAMQCRLWRWRRPVGLARHCRAALHSVFYCSFPGLITQSSSGGIWQEHSSIFPGVWSQVLLVSFFSVISIRTNSHLEFLCVEAYCGFCCQVQI